MTYFLLFIGLFLLVKGADWLVDGASAVAKRFGIPAIIIGLTIVAFGTSLPELLVSLLAAIDGQGETAFGNVVGSNIANLLLILGVVAIIKPPQILGDTISKEIPLSLLAALVLLVFANNSWFEQIGLRELTKGDGIILLFFFSVFIYYVFIATFSKKKNEGTEEVDQKDESINLPLAAGQILLGTISLFIGGRWVVDGAVSFATFLGVSGFLIASTIVAIGTSLPELVTSIRAAVKNNPDLAIGNIVGSNIFNIFFVLGVSATAAPITIPEYVNFDLIFLAATTFLFFDLILLNKDRRLSRAQGYIFLFLYIAYLLIIILRG